MLIFTRTDGIGIRIGHDKAYPSELLLDALTLLKKTGVHLGSMIEAYA